MFWERAFENSLEGGPINWRTQDPESLHAAIANSGRPNYCANCSMFGHASDKCPFHSVKCQQVAEVQAAAANASSPSVGKDVYCTFFNTSICRNNRCTRQHACMFCGSAKHGLAKCPEAPRNAWRQEARSGCEISDRTPEMSAVIRRILGLVRAKSYSRRNYCPGWFLQAQFAQAGGFNQISKSDSLLLMPLQVLKVPTRYAMKSVGANQGQPLKHLHCLW